MNLNALNTKASLPDVGVPVIDSGQLKFIELIGQMDELLSSGLLDHRSEVHEGNRHLRGVLEYVQGHECRAKGSKRIRYDLEDEGKEMDHRWRCHRSLGDHLADMVGYFPGAYRDGLQKGPHGRWLRAPDQEHVQLVPALHIDGARILGDVHP